MAANNKLPVMLILGGIGAAIAMIFAFSGKSSNTVTPKTNPDPVNHPNAVLISGVWRDNNYYFDTYSLTWKPLSSMPTDITTGGASGVFDRIFPSYRQGENSNIIYNYLSLFIRVTSGYESFQPGDNVKMVHKDYNGKTGTITQKFRGTDGNYLAVSIPWNFLSLNMSILTFGSISIKYNNAGGQLIKIS